MARIYSLNPAGPLFKRKDLLVHLDKLDAKFVDVIHTNTKSALRIKFGSGDSSGHLNFYVYGGQHQSDSPSV